MGMQDRDWYKDAMREKAKPTTRRAKAKRVPVDLLDNANPPRLWGADFHWSLKLLIWLAIAALLGFIARVVLKL